MNNLTENHTGFLSKKANVLKEDQRSLFYCTSGLKIRMNLGMYSMLINKITFLNASSNVLEKLNTKYFEEDYI